MIKEECYPLGVVVLMLAEQVFLPLGEGSMHNADIHYTVVGGESQKEEEIFYV